MDDRGRIGSAAAGRPKGRGVAAPRPPEAGSARHSLAPTYVRPAANMRTARGAVPTSDSAALMTYSAQ